MLIDRFGTESSLHSRNNEQRDISKKNHLELERITSSESAQSVTENDHGELDHTPQYDLSRADLHITKFGN